MTSRIEGTGPLDVQPVIVPHPQNVVGANDCFMWPIATKGDDTTVVLYARSPCHWGEDSSKSDANSGIRETHYAQGYSETGWFPFSFALSSVGPVGIVDTPGSATMARSPWRMLP